MSVKANETKNSSKSIAETLDSGTYPGRLVQVVDIGLQPSRPYQGKEKPPAYMIVTTWELSDEFMRDEDGSELKDRPRWYSERFPLFSLMAERATSTQRYNALDPEHKYGGDWSKLLGSPAMITLVVVKGKNGKVYSNIAGIAPVRPKQAHSMPPLVNPPIVFDMDNPSVEAFKSLPEWMQKLIQTGLEYKGSKLDKLLSGDKTEPQKAQKELDLDDEIPF
jgi:hypothetical protein